MRFNNDQMQELGKVDHFGLLKGNPIVIGWLWCDPQTP